ncbi:unnamed protein product [Phaedon cochleariae]|uniref:Uncharacterized protein n=1 Tax=Phaedon cochleariae TaxID=80249 RepID=A0A9N9X064_PHACE|nr:unnamed protein product [Phaedon cochleariae]
MITNFTLAFNHYICFQSFVLDSCPEWYPFFFFQCPSSLGSDTFKTYGNPFQETSTELFALDSRIVVNDECLRLLLDKGVHQCRAFFYDRLIHSKKSISEPITKNNKIPFKNKKNKQNKSSKVKELKSDVTLFSRLHVVSQNRDGDLTFFFKFENHPYPPSLAQLGQMYHGTESDLLRCLDKYITVESKPTDVDAVLIDGAALVHILQPKACCTFQEYISLIVEPYILRILDTSKRIDVIWDIYIDKRLKASTREKMGKGKRKLVRENTSIPRNWNDFLRDSENKKQLFDSISNHLKDMPLPENTVVVCNTIEQSIK